MFSCIFINQNNSNLMFENVTRVSVFRQSPWKCIPCFNHDWAALVGERSSTFITPPFSVQFVVTSKKNRNVDIEVVVGCERGGSRFREVPLVKLGVFPPNYTGPFRHSVGN